MHPRERIPYSAIVDRPKIELPDGNRLVVWTAVNVEVGATVNGGDVLAVIE